ncbi:hypothetical protein TWF506_003202 [Arthrobotrys conoides]|uniref:Serine protease n=1 Tax=Arthrobotrys conoides TaxID=74498 RepID=A0AAN8N523_9PEZI
MNQDQPFYRAGAAREVVNPGYFRSRPEPEPEYRWDPISSTCPASITWEKNLDGMVEYLTQKGIAWTVLHLGVLNEVVTVAILYESTEDGVWDRQVIEQDLRNLYLPSEIFPQIKYSQAVVNKEAGGEADKYGSEQSCGARIGIKDLSWTAGTVGGYFEAESGDLYGLTCHHVLLPTKNRRALDDDDESRPRLPLKKGYPEYLDSIGIHHAAFRPENGTIEVVQPPSQDHAETLRGLQVFIKRSEEGLEDIRTKYRMADTLLPSSKTTMWERRIEEANGQLEVISSYNRAFGVVVASSGYKVDPKTQHSIDWALFKIPSDRPVWNMLRLVEGKNRPGVWDSLSTDQVSLGGVADPTEGEEVFKFGGTTGATFGVVNGVKDSVNLRENLRETREWCVLGRNGRTFSDAGDSGSLVFNQQFQVIGIITAGCDYSGRLTYITPIKLVLLDIQQSTGLRLSFWNNEGVNL